MDPWIAILLSTWLSSENDVKHTHNGYNLDLKTELNILFHNFLNFYLLFGLFFADPVIHFIVAFIVFVSRVAIGDCLLSVWQKQWVDYTDEDALRIHGEKNFEEKKLYVLMWLVMCIDLWKYSRHV